MDTQTRLRRGARENGFSILELMIGGAILAIALLGHTASLFSEHSMSTEERARSVALGTASQMVERMRADASFEYLYDRLLLLQELSRRAPAAADLWYADFVADHDPAEMPPAASSFEYVEYRSLVAPWYYDGDCGYGSPAHLGSRKNYHVLRDGRRAFEPQVFFPGFMVPAGISSFHLAVEVPASPPPSGVTPVLREDSVIPRYGLPADLSGDSAIDAMPHSTDYQAIPVVFTFHWSSSRGSNEETRIATWLWGNR
jgi:hypothetical protein